MRRGGWAPAGATGRCRAAASSVACSLPTRSLSTAAAAAVGDLMTKGALRFATPDQPLSSAVSKLDKVLLGAGSLSRGRAGGRAGLLVHRLALRRLYVFAQLQPQLSASGGGREPASPKPNHLQQLPNPPHSVLLSVLLRRCLWCRLRAGGSGGRPVTHSNPLHSTSAVT